MSSTTTTTDSSYPAVDGSAQNCIVVNDDDEDDALSSSKPKSSSSSLSQNPSNRSTASSSSSSSSTTAATAASTNWASLTRISHHNRFYKHHHHHPQLNPHHLPAHLVTNNQSIHTLRSPRSLGNSSSPAYFMSQRPNTADSGTRATSGAIYVVKNRLTSLLNDQILNSSSASSTPCPTSNTAIGACKLDDGSLYLNNSYV